MRTLIFALVLTGTGCVGGFENDPFESGTGVLSGTLVGPIAAEHAYVSVVGQTSLTASVATDGRFRLVGVPRGTHRVAASTGEGRAGVVDVEAFAERTIVVTLPLKAAAGVAGRVSVEAAFDGAGIARVAVEGLPLAITADARGMFELPGLPEGCWDVVVSREGFRSDRARACLTAGEWREQPVRLRHDSVHLGEQCAPCAADDECAGGRCLGTGAAAFCTHACDMHQLCPAEFSCAEDRLPAHACALPNRSCVALADFAAHRSCAADHECGLGAHDAVCDVGRCTVSCTNGRCPDGAHCVSGVCR